ncbi:MAG: prepilin-type N-terminal cleavage/methylation domain-containing protein [Vulcanimicrobiota bacterium]
MKKNGFTLIELMIVIAIIAILASIMIPNITRAKERAQLTGCMEILKALSTTGHLYMIDHPVPPNTYWVYHSSDPSMFDGPGNFAPDYIRESPVCPALGYSNYRLVMRNDGGWEGSGAICEDNENWESPHQNITKTPCQLCFIDAIRITDNESWNGYYNAGGDTNR